MIIHEKTAAAINDQIRNEFAASSQYVAIAAYFDSEGLPDLASFFYAQAEEERMHAMKFVHFMLETGARPRIPGLPDVQNDFESAADAVQYALDQEIKVTGQINNIVSVARTNKDHISDQFLQWFVSEQVEEIDSMGTLLNTIKHSAGNLLLVEDFVRRTLAARAAAAGGEAQ